ncbi:MAG: hypothetical protein IJ484_07995, partial [Oscillospiraceae bacterium]|nr:hypothetical protein [Oscillospiraceae bacterium]
ETPSPAKASALPDGVLSAKFRLKRRLIQRTNDKKSRFGKVLLMETMWQIAVCGFCGGLLIRIKEAAAVPAPPP